MKVEIRANGRLELRITSPEGRTQEAALDTIMKAILNGQAVTIETIQTVPGVHSGIQLSLETL